MIELTQLIVGGAAVLLIIGALLFVVLWSGKNKRD